MYGHRELTHPRDEIVRTMERIYRYRMTTTSGGNLSIRDDDGSVWITPARVDKGSLRREDVVRVRPDGIGRGPAPAVVGIPLPPGDLRLPARLQGDRPRPPGRPGGVQHLPTGPRHPLAPPVAPGLRGRRVRPVRPSRERGARSEHRGGLRRGVPLPRAGEPRGRDRRRDAGARL